MSSLPFSSARSVHLLFLLSTSTLLGNGDSSLPSKRDVALKAIKTCLKRNEVSSSECRGLSRQIDVLIDVYRAGDKSVLPTLFLFTDLTDFYDDALLSDPGVFLTAMGNLPEQQQELVSVGFAGGASGLLTQDRFMALRAVLTSVPESSPTQAPAALLLTALETNNAIYFISYFPASTFEGPAADFILSW